MLLGACGSAAPSAGTLSSSVAGTEVSIAGEPTAAPVPDGTSGSAPAIPDEPSDGASGGADLGTVGGAEPADPVPTDPLPTDPLPPAGDDPGAAEAEPQEAPPLGPDGRSDDLPADPGASADPEFSSSVSVIDDDLAARMTSSWRPGCPVPLADLRYLTVTYRGFDGAAHTGELVVASSVTADVATVFEQLYAAGYPIQSLRLVDDFGGSDDASMAANNSSAFNCRAVTGGSGFSEHSYGTAVDLNPIQNPYVSGASVLPDAGRAYTDRVSAPGVIKPGDVVVTTFAAAGWTWGGTWTSPVDYQHFSVSGR